MPAPGQREDVVVELRQALIKYEMAKRGNALTDDVVDHYKEKVDAFIAKRKIAHPAPNPDAAGGSKSYRDANVQSEAYDKARQRRRTYGVTETQINEEKRKRGTYGTKPKPGGDAAGGGEVKDKQDGNIPKI